ncbi:MAG: NAD(P)-binding protein [Anaerolineales bacterium]|jgi:prolycopene isomerase
MRILPDTILKDCYDVIVVGAGLGGMTAGSLLAKRGLSVLMIDQQNKPGGACTSFKREDHVFDVGAAMLYGFGEKGFRPFRFLLNELEEPIDIVAHVTLARMTFEGHPIVFWPDIERFLQELYALFPEEKEGLQAFYTDLYKMYENIVIKNEVISPPSEFSPRQGLRRLLSDPLAILKMQKLLSTSTQDLLNKYFHTPEIINFFDKLCSAYSYTTAAETPAVLAATMFIDNHVGGVYFPAGGAQMLPNTIEKAFERLGGQVLYRKLVDEILIQGDKAYGVRLQDGVEIRAERVLANATVWNIYGKLVRPEHIPPERLEWVRSLVPTYPSMTLYMVVDRQGIPKDIYPWEIYIENRQGIDSTDLTLYINSLVDTTLCPADELVVMAIAPNMCDWPHPDDPRYQSADYEAQKQHEAGRMLDQIEGHIPGFRQHIRNLIIGTPSTIERFLLKNGGAVGGPKNQIGQEMLKRLHARSEWKNLYFCGDSTVMGTGAPATTVSGVGAANVILRELRLPEYDAHKFSKQYVNLVDLPYRRPDYRSGDAITSRNAHLAASHCQGCQTPACVAGCPAGIDIPGFLRRMEAGNFAGAARLIREKNLFGEVCGLLCAADLTCQRNCYRRDFTGKPVRIAELQRWVCAEADQAGWLKLAPPVSGPKVAVIGGGPSALSCAYYLALAGCRVSVFAREEQPGDALLRQSDSTGMLGTAVQHDVQGIMSSGIDYKGGLKSMKELDLDNILENYAAVYLTELSLEDSPETYTTWLGANWRDLLDRQTGQVENHPGVFFGEEFWMNGVSVVEAAAGGRQAAIAIQRYLKGTQ